MKILSPVTLDALRSQRDNGLLGVVAARARIAEGHLNQACEDGQLLFTNKEIADLEETLGTGEDAATYSEDMDDE